MNAADLLTGLHQAIAGKAGSKANQHGNLQVRNGKDKAEQFREQMRQMAKEPTVDPQPVKAEQPVAGKIAASPLDAAAILAELTELVRPAVGGDHERTHDENSADLQREVKPAVNDWRGADTPLGMTIAQIDRGGVPPAQGEVRETELPAKQGIGQQAVANRLAADDASMVSEHAAKADPSEAARFAVSADLTDPVQAPVMKAAVRDQETHFEPVQQTTTLQKIVDRMASDLPSLVSSDKAPVADMPTLEIGKAADSRPVRMMTLELDPPHLGAVTVKMRIAGDAVEIHLAADRYETTQILRQELGVLTDAMQSAGYSFDIASIDHARTTDAGQNGNGQQQSSSDQRPAMSSSGHQQADGGSAGRSSSDAQSGARQNRQQHERDPQSLQRRQEQTGNVRSSTVYL